MAYTIGIDLGTYSTKGVLLDEAGEIVAAESREHELSMPRPGWAEHDAETVWWGGFSAVSKSLMSSAAVDTSEVKAVGVSGISPCVLPVSAEGDPLRPAILYGVDTRATAEISELNSRLGEEWIRSVSGAYLSAQSAGPKILWLRQNEPELWERTRWIMNSSTYLSFRLTGKVVLDNYTAAFYHPLFDVNKLQWSERAAQEICPIDMLPATAWAGDAVGELLPGPAAECGLPAGIPVIAGTADAASEAVAAGVNRPGDTMIMYGSSNFFITVTEALQSGGVYWPAPFLWKGTYAYAGGMATAGSLTQWFGRELTGEDSSRDNKKRPGSLYETLAREAESVPAGSDGLLTLPYFSGERTPLNDPLARGVVAGLTLSHSRAHLYRSVLEGVAFGIRHNMEEMTAVTQEGRLFGIGGGTKNRLWMQIVSDILGKPQLLSDSPGASYGDAALAAVHVGILGSREQIAAWLPEPIRVEPNAAVREVYERRYELFRSLYRDSLGTVHALAKEQQQ